MEEVLGLGMRLPFLSACGNNTLVVTGKDSRLFHFSTTQNAAQCPPYDCHRVEEGWEALSLISKNPGACALLKHTPAFASLKLPRRSQEQMQAKAPSLFVITVPNGRNVRAWQLWNQAYHRYSFPELTSASVWWVSVELHSLCSKLLTTTIEIWEDVQTLHIQAQNLALWGQWGSLPCHRHAQLQAIVTYHKLAFLILEEICFNGFQALPPADKESLCDLR